MKSQLLSLTFLFGTAGSLAQVQEVIELQDTIRGNQEQPKVMTIVPWQAPTVKKILPSAILERINKPFLPIERDKFKRQLQAVAELPKSASSQP